METNTTLKKTVDLPLTPFSKSEMAASYTLNEFDENGKPFAILTDGRNSKSTRYKFGVIIGDQYFWFFNNQSTAESREKAHDVYLGLDNYCKSKNLGKAFAYKMKTRS